MLKRLGTPALSVAIAALAVGPSFAGPFDAIQVPEPATISIFGVGLASAYVARKLFGRK